MDTTKNVYIEQQNSCWINKQPIYAELTCFTNLEGQYKLTIFGGPHELKIYPQLEEYKIYLSISTIPPKGFPNAYSKSDIQITEPLYNPLILFLIF